MRSYPIFAVIAVILALFVVSGVSAEEKQFVLRSFLLDQTDHFSVHRAIPNKEHSFDIESIPVRQVLFFNQNATSTLKSTTFLNDTDAKPAAVTDILNFFTTFDDAKDNTGAVKSVDDKVIFEFAFTSVHNIAIASGVIVATGEAYTWTVPTPNSFIFTIFNKDSSVKEVYVARKVFIDSSTFWSKYGTYLLMGVLMIFNFVIQSKTRNMQPSNPDFDPSIEAQPAATVAQGVKPAGPAQPKAAAAAAGAKSKKTD